MPLVTMPQLWQRIVTTLVQHCHHLGATLSQPWCNIVTTLVTTLVQHCHDIVTTLIQHCHNHATTLVTTLVQHCHDIVTTLIQHCHNHATTLSQPCSLATMLEPLNHPTRRPSLLILYLVYSTKVQPAPCVGLPLHLPHTYGSHYTCPMRMAPTTPAPCIWLSLHLPHAYDSHYTCPMHMTLTTPAPCI